MRPAHSLRVLRSRAIRRLDFLARVAAPALSTSGPGPHRTVRGFATIELVNCWHEFARAYYLSCAIRTRNERGAWVLPSLKITSVDQAVDHAVTNQKPWLPRPPSGRWPRRREPAWHDPNVLIRACGDIGVSNMPDILAAFSLPTRVFFDAPVARNFFAHRNHSTSRAASRLSLHYGLAPADHPVELLALVPSGALNPLLLEWIADATEVVHLLCR